MCVIFLYADIYLLLAKLLEEGEEGKTHVNLRSKLELPVQVSIFIFVLSYICVCIHYVPHACSYIVFIFSVASTSISSVLNFGIVFSDLLIKKFL